MTFDASREAQKLTTMATDLMSQDAHNISKDAACPLMNEWLNLSADERNETWDALQKSMPSESIKVDENNKVTTSQSASSLFGPLVSGRQDKYDDTVALTFNGPDGDVGVASLKDSYIDGKTGFALRSVRTSADLPLPITYCEGIRKDE